jgi:hypothetical protein
MLELGLRPQIQVRMTGSEAGWRCIAHRDGSCSAGTGSAGHLTWPAQALPLRDRRSQLEGRTAHDIRRYARPDGNWWPRSWPARTGVRCWGVSGRLLAAAVLRADKTARARRADCTALASPLRRVSRRLRGGPYQAGRSGPRGAMLARLSQRASRCCSPSAAARGPIVSVMAASAARLHAQPLPLA